MMATAIKRHRPTYPQLIDMITRCGGNLSRVGAECGYSARSVQGWIKDAHEPIKIGLLEAIAKAKAIEARSKLLKHSVKAFIIPSELKALVSLHYRLSDAELNQIEIDQVLAAYDTDPDKPQILKYKLTWSQLAAELAKIENMTIQICGRNINRWYLHVLMHWVGLGDESPVFDDYDYLPEVTFKKHDNQDQREVYLKFIEPVIRLLIKRLEKYL